MNKNGLGLVTVLGILLVVAVVACLLFKDTVPIDLEQLTRQPDSTVEAGILTAGIANVQVLKIP